MAREDQDVTELCSSLSNYARVLARRLTCVEAELEEMRTDLADLAERMTSDGGPRLVDRIKDASAVGYVRLERDRAEVDGSG